MKPLSAVSFMLAALVFSYGADAERRWGGMSSFLFESVEVTDDDTFKIVLIPTGEGDTDIFGLKTCKRFEVTGEVAPERIQTDLIPRYYYPFSKDEHQEAIDFLQAAATYQLPIGFGTWGYGSFKVRSCSIQSYGLVAKAHSSDDFMDFFTWPSWN